MKLTKQSICNKEYVEAGFKMPSFNIDECISNTKENPTWIHFGAGNIFRGFPARLQQKLLNEGFSKTGIIVAEGFDFEIIEKIYRPHDNLSALATLKTDGDIQKEIVASIAESLIADASYAPEDWNRLKEVFRSPSLQMATFTVTEKGYNIASCPDFDLHPEQSKTLMGKITALCIERFNAGKLPIALLSMDNCSHNGSRLFEAVTGIASKWEEKGFAPKGFVDWLKNPDIVSFPWSMIDKITPRPDAQVQETLKKCGFEDTEVVVTGKNTWIAPFVNAEECEYLVIEDLFPNGRPLLEKAGVIFTDRKTVDRVEKMKVCTCLNPLHTALAIYGNLLSYSKIFEEMHDESLVKLISLLGKTEGMPVVVNPGIISPEAFLNEVLTIRLPNPFMPDTPQRIACDTSQKLPVRFGETLKAYAAKGLSFDNLVAIPLVFAGWLRYLMAVNDDGNQFELSYDPLIEKIQPKVVSKAVFGKVESVDYYMDAFKDILSDKSLFGIDLYETPLARKVCEYFAKLIEGKGSVKKFLSNVL